MSVYPDGKVYKITNDVDKDIYIGCTFRDLKTVMYEHQAKSLKSKYKLYHSPAHSFFHDRMSIDYNITTWKIKLVLQVSSCTKQELRRLRSEAKNNHIDKYAHWESWCY